MLHVLCFVVILLEMTAIAKCLAKNGKQNICKLALRTMFVVYVIGYLYFVFFSRSPGLESRIEETRLSVGRRWLLMGGVLSRIAVNSCLIE